MLYHLTSDPLFSAKNRLFYPSAAQKKKKNTVDSHWIAERLAKKEKKASFSIEKKKWNKDQSP